jgi:hypothetical protein
MNTSKRYIFYNILLDFMFNNGFFLNRALYEILWKNVAEPGRPQMTIWILRIAYWMPETTNTHSVYAIMLFHSNND